MLGVLGARKRRKEQPEMNPALDAISGAEYSLITSNWKGAEVLVRVRNLSPIQFRSCGDFSFIDLESNSRNERFSWKKWADYAETNYRVLRAALVEPTYDEIMAVVGRGTMVADAEARFREIDALVKELPRGPARQELERLRDATRCQFDFIFPDDFVAPIVFYEGAPPGSDIRRLSGERGREILLEAAILADRGHDNPHDHIQGHFTPFNLVDIDKRAWQVLEEHRENLRRKREAGHAR